MGKSALAKCQFFIDADSRLRFPALLAQQFAEDATRMGVDILGLVRSEFGRPCALGESTAVAMRQDELGKDAKGRPEIWGRTPKRGA